MKTQFKLSLLSTSLLVGAASLATPAFAQDQEQEQDTAAAEESTIVVTGTLISNPNIERSAPVTSVGQEEIEFRQANVAEQLLREIPGVVPNIGSAVNNGNGGASFVDLRGLGANRNIVLLDGNRIAPSGLAGQVDLNNIPLALVERVDALTGSAVTTYGADAITGVVNFITRKDFAGLEVAAAQQITEEGDGNVFRIDATVGVNFDDGRGNAVLSLGYQEADPVYQGQRPFSLNTLDSYSNTFIGSGTSVPSRLSGTRPLVGGVPSTTAPFVQTGTTTVNRFVNGVLTPVVVPVLAPFAGGLANNDPATGGGLRQIDPATGQAGRTFATYNFNPFNIFQTPFERFNIFGQANYEIADGLEVYTRGMFSKNTVKTIIAPSGSFGGAVTVNLNNPFLPAALRNQLCAFNVAPTLSGVTATGASASGQAAYTPRFTPAQCAAAATATNRNDPNYREVTVTLNRRTPEVGPRISEYVTTIFDYRIGFRGDVTDTIAFDVNGSYGESENTQTLDNYTLQSRFRQGVLVDGTAANPVCQNPANGCVPVNIFGPEGSISAAAANYLSAASITSVKTSLAQVRATVSGDFGFTLPTAAEPIAFAAGAEYRNYKASQFADLAAQTPGELGGSGGAVPVYSGGYDVYEIFGELIAPLVEDKPFFKSLTLEAGARYSDYKVDAAGSPGYNATTWKVGAGWEPVDGAKVRGSYSRAVRAPNLFELFNPISTGLTNLGVDPCAGAAPTGNANLLAVCLAQGAPLSSIGNITNPTAAQANFTNGGSLALSPETANTWTAGLVLTPSEVPGLTVSVDYYNIKVKDVIGLPLPGDLISACFGNLTGASATSAACTVIRRNPTTGGLDGDPATTGGLFAQRDNQGRLSTDGVDLIVNYNTNIGFADLGLSFIGNWTNSSKFQAAPSALNRECVGYYSVNCSFTGSIQPEFQFTQRTTLAFEDVDLSLLWRWTDAVEFEPAQLADDIAGAIAAGTNPVTGCPDPTGTDPNGCVVDPEFRRIKAEHYFDLTARWNVTDAISFTLTVQNMLDNKPKVVGNTIGSTTFNSGNTFPSTYDALGRRFGAAVKLRF